MGVDVMSSSLLAQVTEQSKLDLSVFHQSWWQEIAQGFPGYREVKAMRNGRLVGRLPFVLRRNRLGLAFGQDPYWTHLGGPVVEENLSVREKLDVLRDLLKQLPRRASFTFTCDQTLCYADLVRTAFFEAGFEHSSQITYVRLPEGGDVQNERKRKHRGHIKRAAKRLACVDITPREFVRYFGENLMAQGKRSYAPLNMLMPLIQQALDRGCARVLAAKQNPEDVSDDSSSSALCDAAIVYIWDDRRCFYWLSTYRVASENGLERAPHPDAVKLLMITAMEHAQAMNLIFDADGVATPGADHLYRKILGLKIEERRDVFRRINTTERIYQNSKLRIMQWRSEHFALSST
ncbi:MAG: hypothetical protein JST28_23890 [Acidobacteria bacterium]|nr:hypothetical protein [Acidobacteriota bacterium]